MVKNVIQLLCLTILLVGCKTTTLQQFNQKKTTQQITLGSIGLSKDFVLQPNYYGAAIPNYIEPIKVMVSAIPFTKQNYKQFLKANKTQKTNVEVHYVDSVNIKPIYFKIQIADKVGVIKALNNTANNDVKTYLSYNKNANLINGISIALTKKDTELLQKADAVFLEMKAHKSIALQLYTENKTSHTIWLSQGVVFGFESLSCCWQQDQRHKLNIIDVISPFTNCPKSTYKSAIRAMDNTQISY
ncbi:hypothetical protein [Neotamlana laminarinivorans]|uniref:Lipoprotein n=1 Tax=Neotamlana laminarinivorans TaxID=2883124 RepID=A0A9X1L3H0_9FLAO|nr:hypothetical protein [Tamlana laminarinivorans]MCB4797231.1 hypothetical protein [Tamlana laminarinivorans]